MSDVSVSGMSAPAGSAPEAPKPKNAGEAAAQFESLLIAQMMRSAHEAQDDEDQTSETMWDVAAQHFSQVMASNGGFGMGKLIEKGLDKKTE